MEEIKVKIKGKNIIFDVNKETYFINADDLLLALLNIPRVRKLFLKRLELIQLAKERK